MFKNKNRSDETATSWDNVQWNKVRSGYVPIGEAARKARIQTQSIFRQLEDIEKSFCRPENSEMESDVVESKQMGLKHNR